MPPKTRRQANQEDETKPFTLEDAINYFNSLPNAKNSTKNWKDCITTLINYNESGLNTYETNMTKNELFEKYKDIDIEPLIHDVDKVIDIVDKKLLSSVSKQPIALDTMKQYFLSVVRLSQKKSPFKLDKTIRDKYIDKLAEIESESNKQRNKNEPKRAVATYPDFTWFDAETEYKDFITTHAFTNTIKGRKDLRIACIVGLYVIQRPRRAQDYNSLQYFSKKPTETEATNRNILYTEKGKMYVSIDVFKTRWRVQGASKEKKQQLPRYIKEVNPFLASLLKDYIKKWNINDMSKLTPEEKKKGVNYYVFHLETGSQETKYDGGFSKYISTCCQKVFNNRKNITPNTFRHLFNTYITDNLNEFNDNQLNEISLDVGDTPKNMASNLRYRHQKQVNKDLEKTTIEGIIRYRKDAIDAMNIANEDVASVGDIPDNIDNDNKSISDVDEIQSPAPVNNISTDTEIQTLYTKLGEAHMNVKTIELLIQRKLGMGT